MSGPASAWRDGLFAGRVLWLTGARSGGAGAIAELFGRLGATVECTAGGDAAAADAQAADVWQRHGRIDALIVVAMDDAPRPAPDGFDAMAWRTGVDASLNGTWYAMHAAARQWRDQKAGGSVVAVIPPYRDGDPSDALGRAVGASIAHLAKTVAVEWAEHGIRVNCVAPASPDAAALADAVVWLSAPSGKFVTGEVLNVGALAQRQGS